MKNPFRILNSERVLYFQYFYFNPVSAPSPLESPEASGGERIISPDLSSWHDNMRHDSTVRILRFRPA